MGVENNEYIIATTWNKKAVKAVMEWVGTINEEFQCLFTVIPSVANGVQTIVMGPDGSKKGWDVSNIGNNIRDQFIDQLKTFNYEDGSNPFDWVEVGYGEFGQKVLRGNCKNCCGDEEYCGD